MRVRWWLYYTVTSKDKPWFHSLKKKKITPIYSPCKALKENIMLRGLLFPNLQTPTKYGYFYSHSYMKIFKWKPFSICTKHTWLSIFWKHILEHKLNSMKFLVLMKKLLNRKELIGQLWNNGYQSTLSPHPGSPKMATIGLYNQEDDCVL